MNIPKEEARRDNVRVWLAILQERGIRRLKSSYRYDRTIEVSPALRQDGYLDSI